MGLALWRLRIPVWASFVTPHTHSPYEFRKIQLRDADGYKYLVKKIKKRVGFA